MSALAVSVSALAARSVQSALAVLLAVSVSALAVLLVVSVSALAVLLVVSAVLYSARLTVLQFDLP